MRMEKQNQFSSFSKLLTKLDATNLGDYELKVLKQEHDYLDRLRHQRIKIEELKKKYDDCESELNEQRGQNQQLKMLLQQKGQVIQSLENQLVMEIGKREGLEKTLQKQVDSDKNKSKIKLKDLQNENQQLKRALRQKDLLLIQMQEQFTQKLKKTKDALHAQRKTLLIQLQQRLAEARSKNTDTQVTQLRNLVSRQNKALKLQNQKFQQLSHQHQVITSQVDQLRQQLQRKQQQIFAYEQKTKQLYNQLQQMQQKLSKQDHNNKLKGQLQDIRRKMAEMQKGEIERIQFIVNQMQ